MTKATRLGVSALMVLGGLSLGAFAGCSDDEETPPPVEEDTGTPDTAKADLGVTDTAVADTGMAGDTAETGPTAPDRAVTIVFAAPDLPPRFLCLGAFSPTDDPTTKDAPLTALPSTGALGVPDMAAPTDPTKTSGFPYGAVVPVPLSESAIAALNGLKVVIYMVDQNPAKMTPATTCSALWKTTRTDTSKWKAFDPMTVKAGEHGVVTIQGCSAAPADMTGACTSPTPNMSIIVHKGATAKPSTGNVGLQFLHLSQFPGNPTAVPPVPGWQNVDIYLALAHKAATGDAGTDGGDAAPPAAPTLVKIATNVKYGDAITMPAGFTLPDDLDAAGSYLVVGTRPGGADSTACISAGPPSLTCLNWTLPLAPFVASYKSVGGGLFPSTNQVIGLVGSPVPKTSGDPTSAPLRIPFARTATWP